MTCCAICITLRNFFSLKWKYFHANISSSLSDLYTETRSTDVTLVSDDQFQFQAHKVVLSACSPVRKKYLLNNTHSHPLIYLRGVKQQEWGLILQFMCNTSKQYQYVFFYRMQKTCRLNSWPIVLWQKKDKHANHEENAEFYYKGNIENLDRPWPW